LSNSCATRSEKLGCAPANASAPILNLLAGTTHR
jgi:hypothetical protein